MSLVDLRGELRAAPMPNGETSRLKEFVEIFLIRACDVLAVEHRDPDAWEAEHLLAAVGAIAGNMYRLAATCADKAMAPPEERAEQYRDRSGACARRQLENAIQTVRQMAAPAD